MDRAVTAIEAIAAHAQDAVTPQLQFPEAIYRYDDRNAVSICSCTQSIQIQFDNLWAYYAPGRKVSFQEGDEELLVEVSRALDEGTFFAL